MLPSSILLDSNREMLQKIDDSITCNLRGEILIFEVWQDFVGGIRK
jgi:hypothetical protein